MSTLHPIIPPAETSHQAVKNFNDDDVYVYVAATKQLVSHYGASTYEYQTMQSRYKFLVGAGETWARGMTAKKLGLWRTA